MTTARNLLYADLAKALTASSQETIRERVLRILDKYRIQLKPGISLDEGQTARESLFQEIMEKCTVVSSSEVPRKLTAIFARYRMQSKQKLQANGKEEGASKQSASDKNKEPALAAKSKSNMKTEPLGGGPIKRTKIRGECPKCHSRGVVLAHSFAGDDYFSCIYCGFQAFRAAIDTDLDLPLAAELLGRRFDEKSETEQEEPSE